MIGWLNYQFGGLIASVPDILFIIIGYILVDIGLLLLMMWVLT